MSSHRPARPQGRYFKGKPGAAQASDSDSDAAGEEGGAGDEPRNKAAPRRPTTTTAGREMGVSLGAAVGVDSQGRVVGVRKQGKVLSATFSLEFREGFGAGA